MGKAGIKFIGPSPDAMRRMGGKAEAKAIAAKAGVPVVPGYAGDSQEPKTLAREAQRIGYPVMIKAVAGGGGRGMRLVEREADFAAALESAQREAKAAFGDARVLLEKVIASPRHIEVQVFGDAHGNVVHLFERDCSLQRRNQKVIEEAPAPGMSPELRARITEAAVACARAVGYEGAGTVEFLVEGGALGPAAPWYFIEMNTRLQVEHPVTEAITGLDLVEWQLRVASRREAAARRRRRSGCRATPSRRGSTPRTRPRASCRPPDPSSRFETPVPEGLRVDSGVEAGSVISPFYDSMIAKLIAHGADRPQAIARLAQGLQDAVVAGPKTNAAFLHALDHASGLRQGRDGHRPDRPRARRAGAGPLRRARRQRRRRAHAAGRHATGGAATAASPWSTQDAFQLGGPRRQRRTVLVDGVATQVEVQWTAGGPRVAVLGEHPPSPPGPPRTLHVVADGRPVYVLCDMRQTVLDWPTFDAGAGDEAGDGTAVRAPIIGRVAKVFVTQGDTVAKGDRIAVVEAMKMEHVLHAPRAGRIDKIAVQARATRSPSAR